MPVRASSSRKAARIQGVNVAVALFTPRDGALAVLLVPSATRLARSKDRWLLPADSILADETLEDAAARIARGALGAAPSLLDQALASVAARTVGDPFTVTYFGLAPDSSASPALDGSWVPTSDVASLAPRLGSDIDIAINGTARKPVISLTSDAQPPLSQSDLLSYLAFGQSSTSLLSSAGSSASATSC